MAGDKEDASGGSFREGSVSARHEITTVAGMMPPMCKI
jgi:hypothetical protein